MRNSTPVEHGRTTECTAALTLEELACSLAVDKMHTSPSFMSTLCEELWITCVLHLCAGRRLVMPQPGPQRREAPCCQRRPSGTLPRHRTATQTPQPAAPGPALPAPRRRARGAAQYSGQRLRANVHPLSTARRATATVSRPAVTRLLTAPAGLPAVHMITRRDVPFLVMLVWWVPPHAFSLRRHASRS